LCGFGSVDPLLGICDAARISTAITLAVDVGGTARTRCGRG
jgi:hypothetical protein